MKLTLLLAATASLATASYPVIAGFGSSYAEGNGLEEPIGMVLLKQLEKSHNLRYDFMDMAEGAAKLLDVSKSQAPKLKGRKLGIIYVLAGGADLNYIPCMVGPMNDFCYLPIAEEEFKYRYSTVLDSLVGASGRDPAVPIYVLTYPPAIGKATKCEKSNSNCTFTHKQYGMISGIHSKLGAYTTTAVWEWLRTGKNYKYRVQIIPMHTLGEKHLVGSEEPWVNGDRRPQNGDGRRWHPTKAGTDAMARYIFNHITGLRT